MTKEILPTTNKKFIQSIKKSLNVTKNLDKQLSKTTKRLNNFIKPLSKSDKLSQPFVDMKKQIVALNQAIVSNDLAGFRSALEAVGINFSELSIQSQQMIRSLNQANKSYGLLAQVFHGSLTIDDTSLISLDTQTKTLIQSFSNVQVTLASLKNELAIDSSSITTLIDSGKKLAAEFSVMNQNMTAFTGTFSNSQSVVTSFGGSVNSTLSSIDASIANLVSISENLGNALSNAIKEPATEVEKSQNSFQKLKDSLKDLFSPLEKGASAGATFDDLKGRVNKLDEALANVGLPSFQTSILNVGGAFQSVTSQSGSMFNKINESIKKSKDNYSLLKGVFNEKLTLDSDAFEKLDDNQKKTAESFLKIKRGIDKTKESFLNFGTTISNMGSKFSESFTKIYNSSGTVGKSLRGIHQVGSDMTEKMSNQMNILKTTIGDKLMSVKDLFSNMAGKAGESFSTIAGKAKESFSNIYNGSGKVATAFRGLVESGSDFSEKMKNKMNLFGMDIQTRIPILGKLGESFSQMSIKAKNGFTGMFQEGSKVRNMLGTLGEKVSSGIGLGFEKSTKVGMMSMDKMVQGLNSVFGFALKALGPAAILGVVLAGLGLLDSQMDGQLSNMVQTAITKGPEVIRGFIQGIIEKLPDLIASGTQLVAGLAEAISVNLPVIIESGIALLQTLIDGVIANLPSLINSALLIIETLATSLLAAAPQLLLMGLELLSALVDGLFQDPTKLVDTVTSIIETLTNEITTSLPKIIEKGIEILVKLAEGMASVLPQLIPVALEAITTLVRTLSENLPKLLEAAVEIIGKLCEGLLANLPQILAAAVCLIFEIVKGLVTNLPKIAMAGMQIIKEIIGALVKAPIELYKAGENMIKGLIDGIGSKINDVIDTVKSFGKKIGDTFKGLFKIHSPSRWMRDEIGAMLPAGLAIGIERNAHIVDQPMDTLASKIILPSLDSLDQQVDSVQKMSIQSSSIQIQQKEKQPATFNIRLGNQQFKAFVEDISEAMGQDSAINLAF
ncbi:phage tail protein [Enterococcus sp. LJL99]